MRKGYSLANEYKDQSSGGPRPTPLNNKWWSMERGNTPPPQDPYTQTTDQDAYNSMMAQDRLRTEQDYMTEISMTDGPRPDHEYNPIPGPGPGPRSGPHSLNKKPLGPGPPIIKPFDKKPRPGYRERSSSPRNINLKDPRNRPSPINRKQNPIDPIVDEWVGKRKPRPEAEAEVPFWHNQPLAGTLGATVWDNLRVMNQMVETGEFTEWEAREAFYDANWGNEINTQYGG